MYFRAYQKLTHILLCEDDLGEKNGKGVPAGRAAFDDCDLMQKTGLKDIKGRDIFEGDWVEGRLKTKVFRGKVESVPDMFKSRGLHPLHSLLVKHGIPDEAGNVEFQVLGNIYENPELA